MGDSVPSKSHWQIVTQFAPLMFTVLVMFNINITDVKLSITGMIQFCNVWYTEPDSNLQNL